MTKTVLAPNAPWPKPDEKLRLVTKIRIKHENVGLDYFLNTHEELKTISKHSFRDKLSGRFKSH
jgi:hypothetical protein